MISRINNAIYKYYFLTWVFILLLFKRQIPTWMQKKVVDVIEPEIVLTKIEKYAK